MAGAWQSLIPETPPSVPIEPPFENMSTKNSLNNNDSSNHTPHPLFSHEDMRRSRRRESFSNKYFCTRRLSSSSSSAFHNCTQNLWRSYSRWFKPSGSHYEKTQGRLLNKNGVYNVKQVNVVKRTKRYISDIFTTLVDAKWRWTLIVFSTSYILSWIVFALIWFLILFLHGDLDHLSDPNWTPCLVGISSFTSVFLFSIETQHTIGYGTRFPLDTCPQAVLTLIAQSIVGVLIEAFMVGVVFAKLSRPKKRAQTLIFSKNAVICCRDGVFYLMLRVGDMRDRSSIFEAHVRAQVVRKKVTEEGEVIPVHQEEIKVGGWSEDEDRILLFWPTLIVHRIDSSSPFYSLSPSQLLSSNLELIVLLEGVVESTGMTTQLRTSYLPHEILWGRRFIDMSYSRGYDNVFDFELFDSTFPVPTPNTSPQKHEELRISPLHNNPHHHQSSDGEVVINLEESEGGGKSESGMMMRRERVAIHESQSPLNSSSEEDESDYGIIGSKLTSLNLPDNISCHRNSNCTCSTNVSDSNV